MTFNQQVRKVHKIHMTEKLTQPVSLARNRIYGPNVQKTKITSQASTSTLKQDFIQGIFFNWASPESAECWLVTVSNRILKNSLSPLPPPPNDQKKVSAE